MIKLFLIAIVLGSFIKVSSSKKYLYICILILFFGIGARHSVCFIDTIRYVNGYQSLGNISLISIPSYFEKDSFFWVLAKIVHILSSGSYTAWFMICGLLYIIPLLLLVKKYSRNYAVSLLLYCALGFAIFSMTGMRQNLAMAFTMSSVYFLLENKTRKFLFFVLLATLFHKTSAVFFLLYFVNKIPLDKRKLFVYSIVCIAIAVSAQTLLGSIISFGIDERLSWYYENQQGLNFSGLLQQILLFVGSLCLLGKNAYKDENKLFVLMSLIGLTFQAMSYVIAEMFRLSMYFSISNCILFANALESYKERTGKSELLFFTIIMLILYFVTSSNNGFLLDYYFFFQEVPISVYQEL